MRRLLNPRRRRSQAARQPPTPTLRFTPYAWAQLLHLRDRGDTEIGGFGVAWGAELLRIDELALVRQRCSPVTVAFADEAVADYFDGQVAAGRRPEQFARVWIHTHPGDSPLPSGTDEETFARVFGRCDWAVLCILARGGQSYARLEWHRGPGGACRLPVAVDYSVPFAGSDPAAWDAAYDQCVEPEGFFPGDAGDWAPREHSLSALLTGDPA
jgi:proteasome lid subunit RPN8/RPN11